MKKLVLSLEETRELKQYGSVEIVRNGFDMLVEYNELEEDYNIVIINPYEKVCLAKETKQEPKQEPKKNTIKILAAIFDPKKMHLYDVKTKGKHPVRLIEGGEYITESEEEFKPSGDMGWYHINQKEYDYYRSQLREVEIEVR